MLADSDEDHLDGSLAFTDNTLWFCSARQGNYNPIDIYTAELAGDQWINWLNVGQQLNGQYSAGNSMPPEAVILCTLQTMKMDTARTTYGLLLRTEPAGHLLLTLNLQ